MTMGQVLVIMFDECGNKRSKNAELYRAIASSDEAHAKKDRKVKDT